MNPNEETSPKRADAPDTTVNAEERDQKQKNYRAKEDKSEPNQRDRDGQRKTYKENTASELAKQVGH
jgi:hypothetical protein